MHSPRPTVQIPRMIRMRAGDNVAIVANDRGLPAGARIADGPTLLEAIPQGHKVALCDIPEGEAIVRYGVVPGRPAHLHRARARPGTPGRPHLPGLPQR